MIDIYSTTNLSDIVNRWRREKAMFNISLSYLFQINKTFQSPSDWEWIDIEYLTFNFCITARNRSVWSKDFQRANLDCLLSLVTQLWIISIEHPNIPRTFCVIYSRNLEDRNPFHSNKRLLEYIELRFSICVAEIKDKSVMQMNGSKLFGKMFDKFINSNSTIWYLIFSFFGHFTIRLLFTFRLEYGIPAKYDKGNTFFFILRTSITHHLSHNYAVEAWQWYLQLYRWIILKK